MNVQLDDQEVYILRIILQRFPFIVPHGHPEWHDLTDRTKMSEIGTVSVLRRIRSKLDADV
jgi:hypothetical protein